MSRNSLTRWEEATLAFWVWLSVLLGLLAVRAGRLPNWPRDSASRRPASAAPD